MKRKNLIFVLVLSVFFATQAYGQTSTPIDLVLLLDTSSDMSSSYNNVNNYISGAFLNEYLRVGDTFHLISFASSPRLDAARRISGVGDVETIIGRMFLQYPVERGANVGAAITYAEQYIISLPNRPKKIVLLSTGSSDTNNLVSSAKTRLSSRNTTLDYVQVTPGQPLTNLPKSGRPAVSAGSGSSSVAPAAVTQGGSARGTGTAATSTQTQSTQTQSTQTQSTQTQSTQTPSTQTDTGRPKAGTAAPGTGAAAATDTRGTGAQSTQDTERPSAGSSAGTGTSGTSTASGTSGSSTSAASGTSSDKSGSASDSTKGGTVSSTDASEASSYSKPDRTSESKIDWTSNLPLIIGIILGILLLLGLILLLSSRRLGSSPNRAMAQAASPRSASPTPRSEERFADHSKDLNSYAAAGSIRRSTPYENKKYAAPVINPTGPLLLNLHVEDQNTAIGKRNIHSLKSGYGFSVGGGKSDDFLIFLVPIPAGIGEIRRDGSTLTFTPRKAKYFPDIGSTPVRDCINKTIRIVSDKNYEMRFRFEMYEDPLIALNRVLMQVKVPGMA